MLYPLTFHPRFKERIWGGRKLASLYDKPIPTGAIGESWEISDRPGDESVIANGPLQGKSIHWLMEHHRAELFGPAGCGGPRFPLLIKILDAQETLSLQVHPPAARAAQLGGEPKTEMWYVAQAAPGSELFAGLKRGVSRAEFEAKLAKGKVAECFHRIPVQAGDAMFLPSGRVHALGGGLVIFEIQQNSDTTYRVYDWDRVDDKGGRRELHVAQSLASIDFEDVEPALLPHEGQGGESGGGRLLVKNDLFEVSFNRLGDGQSLALSSGKLEIVGVLTGRLTVESPAGSVDLRPGQFCLFPAETGSASVQARTRTEFLRICPGRV